MAFPSEGDHAVLLLHGLMGSPLEMLYLGRQLRRAGFSVYVPHLGGYGFGTLQGVRRWKEWQAQVIQRFDELKRLHRHVSVCGLCIGAVLAIALAAERRGEVAALSLLATTLAYDGWSIPWYRLLAPLGYYTPLRYFYAYQEREPFGLKNEKLRRWIAREMADNSSSAAGAARLPMESVFQAHRLIRHAKSALSAVTAPTLVMHAREDDVASPKSAQYVVDKIGSDDVRLVLLADSYHIITMDNEREIVARETAKFFLQRSTSEGNG